MTRPIGCRHDGTWDPANALADTIRDAVAALHPAGAHAQSTGGVHHRGVRDTVTVATLDVRLPLSLAAMTALASLPRCPCGRDLCVDVSPRDALGSLRDLAAREAGAR